MDDLPGIPHEYIGASAGCWAVYARVLARQYGDLAALARAHRLTVDTYAIQHPGRPGRRAIQSVNVHLVGLHLLLEEGVDHRAATSALAAAADAGLPFAWLEPPVPNGTLTVLDVIDMEDVAEHAGSVERWAHDVWAAWSAHHATVRRLAAQARRGGAG